MIDKSKPLQSGARFTNGKPFSDKYAGLRKKPWLVKEVSRVDYEDPSAVEQTSSALPVGVMAAGSSAMWPFLKYLKRRK